MARRRRKYTDSFWPRYVPVAERRRKAESLAKTLASQGKQLDPVVTAGGNKITRTFWGSAWNENLEHLCDHGRLTRGRTYLRNGSVIDLQIGSGRVDALVSGSSVYNVRIEIEPLPSDRWEQLCTDCAGGFGSLVELLEGRFADSLMEILSRPGQGLLPAPDDVAVGCSCPDWAAQCKHVIAVLQGIGVRLDERPELLFTLRQVDQNDLLAHGAAGLDQASAPTTLPDELAGEDLSALFGIDLEPTPDLEPPQPESPQPESPQPESPPAPPQQPTKRRKKAKASKKPAAKASRRKPRPVDDPWITSAELRSRGVPPNVFQRWLHKGLLEHSGDRGIYVRTPFTETLIREYLDAKRR